VSEEEHDESEAIRDELRELLVECQKMNATREASSPFLAMFQAMGMNPGVYRLRFVLSSRRTN
jgi:hypothetical protein